MATAAPTPRRRNTLYVQVLIGVALGIAVGCLWPDVGVSLQKGGDIFIRAVKVVISPIIFSTVVVGLAGMGDLKRAGRVGLKSLAYFEVMTTVALAIGLIVANLLAPGHGIHAVAAKLESNSTITGYAQQGAQMSFMGFVMHLVPETFVGAFISGDPLPVLFLAILVGVAVAQMGESGQPIVGFFRNVNKVFFGVMGIITRYAPVAALCAMAFTVSKFGPKTLISLGAFMGCVYLTCLLFIFVGLAIVARLSGFNLLRILRTIREEILLVLGTSSSESALPGLMERLEENGCSHEIVGIVVPAGYSFNLDGTCIYLTLATLFMAQALDIPMSLTDQLEILAVLLLTSKGAAAVTGGGFITLAATLASTHKLPIEGLVLILGIDRFMSEARALTNLIGNAVATCFIARWEGAFDREKGRALIAGS